MTHTSGQDAVQKTGRKKEPRPRSIGPIRQKQLKLYVDCCRKARKRILAGLSASSGAGWDAGTWQAKSIKVRNIAVAARVRGMARYTSAAMCLGIAQSKFQMELESYR